MCDWLLHVWVSPLSTVTRHERPGHGRTQQERTVIPVVGHIEVYMESSYGAGAPDSKGGHVQLVVVGEAGGLGDLDDQRKHGNLDIKLGHRSLIILENSI